MSWIETPLGKCARMWAGTPLRSFGGGTRGERSGKRGEAVALRLAAGSRSKPLNVRGDALSERAVGSGVGVLGSCEGRPHRREPHVVLNPRAERICVSLSLFACAHLPRLFDFVPVEMRLTL